MNTPSKKTAKRYGKKPSAAWGQSQTYHPCGLSGLYRYGQSPTATNRLDGESCRLRLVRDLAHDEVFTICHHDTVSNVLHRREYANGAPAAPRHDWRLIERKHELEGLWDEVEASGPDRYEILEQSDAPVQGPTVRVRTLMVEGR